MKRTLSPLWALLLCLLFSNNIKAQTAEDSMYHEKLFYICKVWGHLKYYHSRIAEGKVNWDLALEEQLADLRQNKSKDLNEIIIALMDRAGESEPSSAPEVEVIDSINNNSNRAWLESSIIDTSIASYLEGLYRDYRQRENTYVDYYAAGNPAFYNDYNHWYGEYFPTEEVRLLGFFRYWNIIHYFFPYKDVMDQEWDVTLREFIPEFIDATSELEYGLAMRAVTTRINDTHGWCNSPSLGRWYGWYHPPFNIKVIDDQMVVHKVLPHIKDIKPGDIITHIDGIEINTLRDSLRPYVEGSNAIAVESGLADLILYGDFGYFNLSVENENGPYTARLFRNWRNDNYLTDDFTPIWHDTLINNSCRYGIVDMDRLEPEDVESMFTDLWDTDAIVFDIRNYPNGSIFNIMYYLFGEPLRQANWLIPDYSFPGRMYWVLSTLETSNDNLYQGDIYVLFDENTISHAEYTCMIFDAHPRVTKIGSTTLAADGNVSRIYLPGRVTTAASFLGVFYPDFTPTQRVGIVPDIEVIPGIEDLRAGRDIVMETALNMCTTVSSLELKQSLELLLYPNPAAEFLKLQVGDNEIIAVELFSQDGRKLKTFNYGIQEIPLTDLDPGMYHLRVHTEETSAVKTFIKQ